MLITGQQMEVTLIVNGRGRNYTEQQLIEILEEFENLKKSIPENENVQVKSKPQCGEWFEIQPTKLDIEFFEKSYREDPEEECKRILIVKALKELQVNPEKYGKDFKTMSPQKDWARKTVEELKTMAEEIGHHNADWVEQALEWAQRIQNGERWVDLCENKGYHKLVVWKNGYAHIVGGARTDCDSDPIWGHENCNYCSDDILCNTVPLIVRYE